MYEERASALAGAVVWTKTPAPGGRGMVAGTARPVLPDGCMDLLWTPGRLFVAGPDTRAQPPQGGPGDRFAGIRFAPGTAPAVLGVPAHELRDLRVELAGLWGAAGARRLTERVDTAADPVNELESVALETAARRAADGVHPDPLLTRVVRLLDGGAPVAAAAGAVGLGPRALHRRALDAFGYGPKTLARVLRLQRALALVGRGAPYASAAVSAGYADQAHFAREMRALSGMTLSTYWSGYRAGAQAAAKSETPMPSGSSTTA
ncbi:helix-turn-helix domain-containing protein [Streptomyces qinzhouensis]|uniref:Helix-turn-helix domain-containing protein n=1 Tax=Streptomyces qinzhouensis TaxID=2599401 RepID=A0A5B8JH35_9ACTN|nr:helix-turn-helix domain-containing protein [Streptomyces qinzhouensis]QDY79624.1 helix-turn-helix domain-containing protein [Streptomyces qinzhouensis]